MKAWEVGSKVQSDPRQITCGMSVSTKRFTDIALITILSVIASPQISLEIY